MKTFAPHLLACLLATASAFAGEAPPASPAPVQISDVPRNTQMGTAPVPDGAPGSGRYLSTHARQSRVADLVDHWRLDGAQRHPG